MAQEFNTVDRGLVATAAISGILFWLVPDPRPFPLSWPLKMVPAMAMAAFVWRHRSAAGLGLVVALVAHAIGDALLEIDRKGLFIHAMGGFFLGHVLYILNFGRFTRPWAELAAGRKGGIVGLLLFAAGMMTVLMPALSGVIAVAVPIYVIALISMAIFALRGTWQSNLLLVGALSFVISDAMIAINTFLQPIGPAAKLIWPTYFVAQILIPLEFVRSCNQTSTMATTPSSGL